LFLETDHHCGLVVAQEDSPSASTSGVLMEGLSPEDEKALESTKESFTFQAEVNRLMDIIINSLCKLHRHIKFDEMLMLCLFKQTKTEKFSFEN
jgi:hypothetical protein